MILYYIILSYIILSHIILFYIILYYIILSYIKIHYLIIYYISSYDIMHIYIYYYYYIYMIYGWCLQDRDLFVFDDVAGKDGHSRPASYKVISTSSETCQTQGPLDFCAQTFPRSHSLCGKQMDLHSPLVKLVKSLFFMVKSSWIPNLILQIWDTCWLPSGKLT